MSVLVVGISHKSAPVALLERLALDSEGVAKLIADVAGCDHVAEATVISTCNRLEIYADVDRFHGSVEDVSRLLVDRAGASTETLLPHLYVHYDDGAVSHLFHVAAGLDSMVVGEGQILGQTREALRLGQELGTVGPALNVLFQQALRVGKRSHAETDIDRAAPSLVTAALAPHHRAASAVWRAARSWSSGPGRWPRWRPPRSPGWAPGRSWSRTARRSTPSAWRPVRRHARCRCRTLDRALAEADVVITCTGATGILVTAPMLAAARGPAPTAARRHRPRPAARRRPRGRRRCPASRSSGLAELAERARRAPTPTATSRTSGGSSPRRSPRSSRPAARPA